MTRIVAIVEGHGDYLSVPGLLRRLAFHLRPDGVVQLPKPVRVPKSKLLKKGELEKAVRFAALVAGADGAILILMDANGDCPKELAAGLLERARKERGDREIRVVLAKREFEAWFIAAAESIAGKRGLSNDLISPPDPEGIVDAKGWLSAHLPAPRNYRETLDQPALAELFDISAAHRASPSFAKLVRDIDSLLQCCSTPGG